MSFSNSISNHPHSIDLVTVQLPNGGTAKVEVTRLGGKEDVGLNLKPLAEIGDTIEGIIQAVAAPIRKAQPKKATVKFGLELAMESGELTTIIVKGSGKANLEITLEWERTNSSKE